MIPPRAHGTARELARSELGIAEGAAPSKVDQRPPVAHVAVDGENGPRSGIDVDDVVVVAAVLIRVLERAPPGGEREAAVVTDEVAEVRHRASIPRRGSLGSHLLGQFQ